MVDQLISLTGAGTLNDKVRIEAIKSLLNYRHLPRVQKCLTGLTGAGTLNEKIRITAIQVLGGRFPDE